MSTRKTIAKKAAKKAIKKTTRAAKSPRSVAAQPVTEPIVVASEPTPEPIPHVVEVAPVQETFRTAPPPVETRTVPAGEVLVFINGTNRGLKSHNDMVLGDYARKLAQETGIRTFSVYVDDQKANTTMTGIPMGQFGKIEIVSKDSRG